MNLEKGHNTTFNQTRIKPALFFIPGVCGPAGSRPALSKEKPQKKSRSHSVLCLAFHCPENLEYRQEESEHKGSHHQSQQAK